MASTPGSGINKNLLTPCRRVGLSRKRKTPNSIVKILSNDLNSSDANIIDSPVSESTPVNHRKSFSRRKRESFQKFQSSSSPLTSSHTDSGLENPLMTKLATLQEYNNNKTKTDLLNRFSSEDLFDTIKNIYSPENVVLESSTKIIKDNPIEELKKTFPANESEGTKDLLDDKSESLLTCSLEVKKTKISRRSIRRLSDDDFLSSESKFAKSKSPNKAKDITHFNVEKVAIDDSDEDFRIIAKCDSKRKQHKLEKTKRFKKISLKESLFSSTDDEVRNDDNVKVCKVQIERLSEDSICLNETNTNINDKSLKNLVKKPIVTSIDDDDDAFTSTPEQEKMEKKNLARKIKVLEDQIRKKQQKFANLKQASIYKNKHDVEGLKQLSSQWVNGCVLGLNDLLGQLQAHGPMTMTTLVNNLHISSELVAKLPLNVE